ncbi:hypothetical protein [Paraurantiacibacter namhicola]|uniref:Uncharacterized protein n=1 Tax=Paraurantiacibacter namhicola TaxID=645517 RepID=A0A1C7D9K6_9SPHN|nr:hypothetical protein [Paraurantiacibacter namhicola]ANU08170.1 hypothetical protein A6F65_01876 [Paraurantiacibacter namhicola]
MLRQLLTLLALFTGLAATGDVAHARMASVENVAQSVLVDEVSTVHTQGIVALAQMPDARIAAVRPQAPRHAEPPRVSAPVLVPVDRARE